MSRGVPTQTLQILRHVRRFVNLTNTCNRLGRSWYLTIGFYPDAVGIESNWVRADVTRSTLFRTVLGDRRSREVSVSRAFAACFAESAAFRAAIMKVLFKTCRVPPRGLEADWICDAEVMLPKEGRVDLQISCPPSHRGRSGPVFQLENKVSAALTDKQMLRYRRQAGDRHLIALTKAPPETGQHWLRAHGCFALRWQDVHRALMGVGRGGRADHFLVKAFCDYLEDLGMAHREDISKGDLDELARLFRTISAPRKAFMAPGDTFDVASSCLGVLDDVYRDAIELHPKLAKSRRWGPSYFRWVESDGSPWHVLGVRMLIDEWRDWHGPGFWFPHAAGEPVLWTVGGLHKGLEKHRNYQIGSVVSREGVLDRSKLAKTYIRSLREIGVLQ